MMPLRLAPRAGSFPRSYLGSDTKTERAPLRHQARSVALPDDLLTHHVT